MRITDGVGCDVISLINSDHIARPFIISYCAHLMPGRTIQLLDLYLCIYFDASLFDMQKHFLKKSQREIDRELTLE